MRHIVLRYTTSRISRSSSSSSSSSHNMYITTDCRRNRMYTQHSCLTKVRRPVTSIQVREMPTVDRTDQSRPSKVHTIVVHPLRIIISSNITTLAILRLHRVAACRATVIQLGITITITTIIITMAVHHSRVVHSRTIATASSWPVVSTIIADQSTSLRLPLLQHHCLAKTDQASMRGRT